MTTTTKATASRNAATAAGIVAADEKTWKRWSKTDAGRAKQAEMIRVNANRARAAIAGLVARGAMFIVSHSGGKDSQALYAFICANVPAAQIIVIHADLGDAEQTGTRQHVLAQVTRHEVHIAKAVTKSGAEKGFLDMVCMRAEGLAASGRLETVSPWPMPSKCQGTSDLKRGPIAKVIRRLSVELGFSLIVECLGRRAEESERRALGTVECFKYEAKTHQTKGREWYKLDPIVDWTLEQVIDAIDADGQTRHETYTTHGYSRMSCCICVVGSTSDTAISARIRPVLFAKYVAVELHFGKTMHSVKRAGEKKSSPISLEDYAGVTADAALVAQYRAELVATGRVAEETPVVTKANGRVRLSLVA